MYAISPYCPRDKPATSAAADGRSSSHPDCDLWFSRTACTVAASVADHVRTTVPSPVDRTTWNARLREGVETPTTVLKSPFHASVCPSQALWSTPSRVSRAISGSM